MKKVFLFLILVLFQIFLHAQFFYNNPESVVYDSINDRYLVSNWGDGSIVQVNWEGEISYFSAILSRIAGLYIYEDMLLVASNLEPYIGLIGFDLNTDEMVLNIPIEGSGLLNDITSDSNGFVYITDYWDTKVFKVNIIEQTYSIFALDGLTDPNGIVYDEPNNRLLVTSTIYPTYPLFAINIDDGSVSIAIITNIPSQDGIALDNEGNFYISSWYTNSCHRYDPGFENPPEVITSGHSGPADIFFDRINNKLCVPNFNNNTVEFIPIDQNSTEDNEIVDQINLYNYPNPFRTSSTISFSLTTENTGLMIFNIKGQKIKTFLNLQIKKSKNQQILWDGKDNNGLDLSSGIYLCTLKTGNRIFSKKIILTK